jgi:HD-GYP domain-containing protein (c-di-GMP phosphodiesterase class II)
MLSQLPFPRKLLKVPDYASEHHEKLDGSGYPRGLTAKDLPLQSRIIAVADIFEALTARDRPYKKPMHISQVLKIMDMMKKDNHIDPDIYDLFVESRLYDKYLEREDGKDGK